MSSTYSTDSVASKHTCAWRIEAMMQNKTECSFDCQTNSAVNKTSHIANRSPPQRSLVPRKQRCEGESTCSRSSVKPFASHRNEGSNNITTHQGLTQNFYWEWLEKWVRACFIKDFRSWLTYTKDVMALRFRIILRSNRSKAILKNIIDRAFRRNIHHGSDITL